MLTGGRGFRLKPRKFGVPVSQGSIQCAQNQAQLKQDQAAYDANPEALAACPLLQLISSILTLHPDECDSPTPWFPPVR